MKCEKCGRSIDRIELDLFHYDGSDSFVKHLYSECEEEDADPAIVIETDRNWTGYELSEEEQTESIRCPHCRQFPFLHREVQVYETVRIVCFKKE